MQGAKRNVYKGLKVPLYLAVLSVVGTCLERTDAECRSACGLFNIHRMSVSLFKCPKFERVFQFEKGGAEV